jgi:hypothetical protein
MVKAFFPVKDFPAGFQPVNRKMIRASRRIKAFPMDVL